MLIWYDLIWTVDLSARSWGLTRPVVAPPL